MSVSDGESYKRVLHALILFLSFRVCSALAIHFVVGAAFSVVGVWTNQKEID
jgi:hypothetical protein